MAQHKLEIHKRYAFEELHWDCVKERLSAKDERGSFQVDTSIAAFVARYFGNMKSLWVVPAELNSEHGMVAAALCECHGCDELTVERLSRLSIGLGSVPLYQALRFRVSKATDANSSEVARRSARLGSGLVRVGTKRYYFSIRSQPRLILFSALSVLVGAIFYSVATILVVYGLVVFFQFLNDPGGITILATQRADIGLALLSFLVGLAALLGRVVQRLCLGLKRGLESLLRDK